MLRFIIRHKIKDGCGGLESESLQTIDIQCVELEQILLSGGFSESGYEYNELVGVECLVNKKGE